MQTYQAVVEYQRKEATIKYTSKPYNTQKEALTDLNQELKRALKKEQTVTAAYVTAEEMPQEVVKMLMGGVMELADQEAQERFEKKVKELTKTLKAIRGEELGFMGHVVNIKKDFFNELVSLCQNRAFNFSLTWQRMDDWSLEIYTGYSKNSYELKFYTDGHLNKEDAIKEGLEYMQELNSRKITTKAPQF